MRILIVDGNASSTFGGAEKSMSVFSEYLEKTGNEVFLVCEKFTDYAVQNERVEVINLQPPNVQGVFSYLKSVQKLVRFIKKSKIDLLITHTIHAFPMIRIVKSITGIRTMVYFKWVHNQNSIGSLNKWGLRSIKNYVANNEMVGNYWARHLTPYTKIDYITDGILLNLSDSSLVHDKENQNEILYFGRIIESKGLHLLIKALSMLPEKYTLKVLGVFNPKSANTKEATYHSSIVRLVEELQLKERIFFEGHVKNVNEFIKNASLVVVPSIVDDAQPFSILESFALKCPAIGTNRGGIPTIFENDTFWYCEPNENAIFKKIEEVLNTNSDVLKSKTETMFNSIIRKYNVENTQKLLLDFCETAVK